MDLDAVEVGIATLCAEFLVVPTFEYSNDWRGYRLTATDLEAFRLLMFHAQARGLHKDLPVLALTASSLIRGSGTGLTISCSQEFLLRPAN